MKKNPYTEISNWKSFDLLIEGIQIYDFDWKYIYVNDAFVNYTTYSKEELIGCSFMEKYPEMEGSALFEAMSRCMKVREAQKLQTEFMLSNGIKTEFEISIQAIPKGILMMSVDRTEQKKAKDKLVKFTRLYAFISNINKSIVHLNNQQDILDNACKIAVEIGEFKASWIALVDEKGYLNVVSLKGERLMTEELKKYSGLDFTTPILRDTTTGIVLRTGKYMVRNDVQNEEDMKFFKEVFVQHGIKATISLPIIKFGKVIGTFGFHSSTENFFDIEEINLLEEATGDISFALENFEKAKKQKETEELLANNDKRFRALIEKSADMKAIATLDGIFTYLSPSTTKVLGYTVEELLNTNLFDLIHPEDLKIFNEKRDVVLQNPGTSFIFQQRRRHKNGNWVWCEGTITNMLHEPSIQAMVSNFRDISEKKLAEQELEQKNNELIKTNSELDRFVYSASHELRSPIASVLGLANIIELETQEAHTLEYCKMIQNSVNRLDRVIKNILSYSRNNRTEVANEKISLQHTVNEIIELLRNIKNAEGIRFEIDIDEDVPFYSDVQRFNTAVENLISNAIKYHKKNNYDRFIKISAKTNNEELYLCIEDNGIGIAKENHAKIFDMFFRVSGKVQGSGIGLYIVKEIIEKLHGTIEMQSEEGIGTSFTIKLKNMLPS